MELKIFVTAYIIGGSLVAYQIGNFSDLKITKIVRRYIKYKHEKSTTLGSEGCMTLKIKKLIPIILCSSTQYFYNINHNTLLKSVVHNKFTFHKVLLRSKKLPRLWHFDSYLIITEKQFELGNFPKYFEVLLANFNKK